MVIPELFRPYPGDVQSIAFLTPSSISLKRYFCIARKTLWSLSPISCILGSYHPTSDIRRGFPYRITIRMWPIVTGQERKYVHLDTQLEHSLSVWAFNIHILRVTSEVQEYRRTSYRMLKYRSQDSSLYNKRMQYIFTKNLYTPIHMYAWMQVHTNTYTYIHPYIYAHI